MFDVDRKTLPAARATAATPTSRPVTVLLTSVAYFMVTLDALVVVTALPAIHRQLGGGVATPPVDGQRVRDGLRGGHHHRGRAG